MNYEIICVNDKSSDLRVEEFLKTMEAEYAFIKVINNKENLGVANTINKGIEVSRGDYIVFLDCDDYIPSNALREINTQLKKDPDIDYFFTDRIDVDEKDNFIRTSVYGGAGINQSKDIKTDLLQGMVASHLKVIRKSKIVELGGLDPSLDGVQDYDLAFRFCGKGKFKYINKPLYFYRIHTNSVTTADTIRQFRNSNIARRKICNEWYKKDLKTEEFFTHIYQESDRKWNYLGKGSENEQIITFTPKDFSLPKVINEIKKAHFIIFDARDEPFGAWTWFLREYNSYFDLIITNDTKNAVFLIGYLWDYRILRVAPPEI